MIDTIAAHQLAPATSESGPDKPPTGPSRRTFKKWRARAVVLVLVAAAVVAGLRVGRGKAAEATHIDLGTVTLMSQDIPVETPRPGQVTSVDVSAPQKVTAGQRLGSLQVTTTDSEGKPAVSTLVLTAPRTGMVVDDPVTVGSTLQPGQPFVELYDPTKLTFSGEVPLKDLPEISPGMVATLRTEGLKGTVKATVQRVVPRVGSGQNDVKPGFLRVVLVPKSEKDVAGLVPGLRFTGTVDTGTGRPDHRRLLYIGG